ncbi:aminoacyl--tRNA ligase-related protein [Streptomyces sp. TRM64462]|uniref:aminoacyl--tRNA ligase-related protein n=1 Tax=Streptomyces sp. TRM64462 TaxID=2741726 RepID=UPI002816650E|nr:aminoacyl--tRNA ligase-related protein [Streptomyces sp. TRM64462]
MPISETRPGTRAVAPVGVTDGLVTLGPDAVRLRAALDAVFTGWAADAGAAEVLYPPLVRVADLARFDYFTNFPHLALAAAPVDTAAVAALPARDAGPDTRLAGASLGDAGFVLPSAACYSAYLSLSGARLDEPVKLTTIAQCFRRETAYRGMRRLHGFTMREIVAVGDAATVKGHLATHRTLIHAFAAHLGLVLRTEVATDPFFDANGSRAVMQRLFPTKEEFVVGDGDDGLAIASVNYHRNFFGERAGITCGGEEAHTSCVAFGVERWLHVLAERFGGDWGAAEDAVRSFGSAGASR